MSTLFFNSYVYSSLLNLYNFDYFQFYSGNFTGQTGPPLSNFTTPTVGPNFEFRNFGYYSNVINQPFYPTYWSLYLSKPGYQRWTVPTTGAYSVYLCGAPGGVWLNSTTATQSTRAHGLGAVLAGSFNFTRGQNLVIQIGQAGVSWANTNPVQYTQPGRGGGGYSSIVDEADTATPIAVAAGGGGQGWTSAGNNGRRSFYLVSNASINASTRGSDTVGGSNVAGAGWSQSSLSIVSANTWSTDCNGGSNNISFDQGGFGGGGPGGLIASTSVKGGGGGGWIGGGASGTNIGGLGGFSMCQVSNVAVSPLWGAHVARDQFSPNQLIDHKSVIAGMCFIRYINPLYNNFTITFTNCNHSGPTGPGIGNILAAYSTSNITNYLHPVPFAFKHGYQAWSVPFSGVYQITAAGAQGGNCIAASTFTGGLGQIVTSNIWLDIADILIITVGQSGINGTSPNAGSGGGMTTVHRNGCIFGPTANSAATMAPYPLLCAAGGGGAVGNANGGTANFPVLTGTQTSTTGGLNSGCGIYASNGRGGSWDCQVDGSSMTGSGSFGAGLTGGSQGTVDGGFGGGGRANTNFVGGSGGGFRGGATAATSNAIPQGGNSYSYYTVTGTGTNTLQHGYVTIVQL
jgi:hypothetical protein